MTKTETPTWNVRRTSNPDDSGRPWIETSFLHFEDAWVFAVRDVVDACSTIAHISSQHIIGASSFTVEEVCDGVGTYITRSFPSREGLIGIRHHFADREMFVGAYYDQLLTLVPNYG